MKAFTQGIVLFIILLLILFGARQINWMDLLNVKQNQETTERKVGELIWNSIKETEDEIKDRKIIERLDSILIKICEANAIDKADVQMKVIKKDEINAFALPGDYIIIYSGLIVEADHPDELAGVISHELAHIKLNHVMKKLVKEIGMSVLVSMAGGNGGGEVIKETAKLLSSSAFDRSIEKEADLQAVDYLVKAKIEIEPFSNFLYKISQETNELTEYLSWIMTHPNAEDRAKYIIQYGESFDYETQPSLSEESWEELLATLEN